MSILHNTKDAITSGLIKKALSSKLEEYGILTDFIINSTERTITLKIFLKEEEEKTEIFVSDFELVKINEKTWFSFAALHTSKEWLNVMINNRLIKPIQNNRIEIPDKYTYLAQLVFST